MNGLTSRHNLMGIVFLLYFIPIVFLSARTLDVNDLGLGLFFSSIGSIAFLLLLRKWEKRMRKGVHTLAEAKTQALERLRERQTTEEADITVDQIDELEGVIAEKNASIEKVQVVLEEKDQKIAQLIDKNEQSHHQIEKLIEELNSHKDCAQEEASKDKTRLDEFERTIEEQKILLRKKQRQVLQLENKICDLNYEIKTLLQLNEGKEKVSKESIPEEPEVAPSSSLDHAIKSPDEASHQLMRCINIAQKMTGAQHFNSGNMRLRDVPVDNFALDMRRLFDNLHSENASPVVVYSQKESRLLFANHQMQSLLGWSPEAFIQEFPDIVQEGINEWKQGILQLDAKGETRLRLVLKTKSGHDILVHCHLGLIPTGLFKNHVIGVFYPA